jgi:hypothetical protein
MTKYTNAYETEKAIPIKCTAAKQLWNSFTPVAKKQLLAGLHGDIKKSLRLDAA